MIIAIKNLPSVLLEKEPRPSEDWQLRLISNGDCLSYAVSNSKSQEALLIDPKKEDLDHYLSVKNELADYLWLGVIDTHTHADHISAAAEMAHVLHAPLLMHHASPSQRVDLRISRETTIVSRAGEIRLLLTPGHTPDGICVFWGPFIFTGDTVLFGDVGRDDLPGGNPASHYESLQHLKELLKPETLVCPGHDTKGGRISSWATQLQMNSSLTQERKSFIEESAAFEAPAPALFKKSLFENFK